MDTSTAVLEDTEEQHIDKELTEYGIEEQGMTLDEKKNLLLVFKNSESTALAEEHSRVGLGIEDTSNSDLIQSSDPKNNTEAALDCFSNEEASSPASTQPCNVVENAPNDDDDSDDSKLPKQKGVTYSPPKLTPKRNRLSLKSRPTIVGDGDENVDAYSLLSKSNCTKSKSPSFEDSNTKTELPSTEDPTCLKSDLPLSIRKKEDRKRNIDVFNAVKDQNEHPLTINKQLKINGKTPYYVVPHGMDIKEFTIYFKEQLAAMATNLIATQRRSLKLVPWSDPVVASNLENNCTFEEVVGPADNDTVGLNNTIAQNQRYNFRGRANKRKCDDIFDLKLSDEEDSDDDNIFTKKTRPKMSEKNKITTYSGTIAKRKSLFSAVGEHLGEKEVDVSTGDTFISNKERLNAGGTDKDSASEDETKKSGNTRIKNICKSGISRTKETGKHSSQSTTWQPLQIVHDDNDDNNDDDDEDYEIGQENKTNKRKIQKPNTKSLQRAKIKKKVSKPLEHRDSQGEEKNGVVSGVSKSPTWLNTTCFNDQKDDLNVIKPLPINPKMRRLKKPNSALGKTRKKVTKPNSQEVDEPILPIDNKETNIPIVIDGFNTCPMCKHMFDIKEIEDHAADCNGVENPDPGQTENWTSTSRCPICVESFPTGLDFERHAKSCQVKKRLVAPPVGPFARNRSKR